VSVTESQSKPHFLNLNSTSRTVPSPVVPAILHRSVSLAHHLRTGTTVSRHQQLSLNIDPRNHLYRGDCLSELDRIPDESIDLIYIDPPFYSQRYYETFWGEDAAERFAFEDRWKGGIQTYLNHLVDRVRKMHEKLKEGGSLYLHLDWHICHYMKIELDKIMGYGSFQNEIIWSYRRWPSPSSHYQRMHDTILFYSKGPRPKTFNVEYEPNSASYEKRFGGRTQMLDPKTKTRKITLEEKSKGLPRRDVWDISIIAGSSKERIGYPTQKPIALLERIVRTSSNRGDVILDAYCGCGTTLEAAQRLNRRWLGIDISQQAIRVVQNRLRQIGAPITEVHGMVEDEKQLHALDWREFQMWAVDAVQGRHSPRKVADMGIDGFTFMENHPIQVKQVESVGRPVIDNFVGVLERERDKRGLIIAFDFTKGAEAEVARLKREQNIEIELITCKKLIREDIPFRKMA
jgi:DNA modification methylase